MRLSVSNIAWEVQEDQAAVALFRQVGIDAIDIAPGKYFPRPTDATSSEVKQVRNWWNDRGIDIVGMQALLFGTKGLNIFGPRESQIQLLTHLDAVCRIGGELGATRVVFGSPKNRDRSGLDDQVAFEIAVSFFQRLAVIAANHGVTVCLEPNPPRYGSNFMINSATTAQVVQAVNHQNIKMQFDTGALTINEEDPVSTLLAYANLIGHIHASEPDLVPLGDGLTAHQAMADAIELYLPAHLVTVEMVASKNEPHLLAIERALHVAVNAYRATLSKGTQ